ncbi:hypothetical protein KI387_044421, partial [Taxus chinensis]
STTMATSAGLSHSDGSEGFPTMTVDRVESLVDIGIGIGSYFDREVDYIT